MFLKQLLKRIFGRLWYGKTLGKRRQRNPSSFQECLDPQERSRDIWKPIILALFLLPSIYYFFHHRRNIANFNIEPFDESSVPNVQKEGTDPSEIIYTYAKDGVFSPHYVQKPRTRRPKKIYLLPRDNLPLCASITVAQENNVTNTTVPSFPATVPTIGPDQASNMGVLMGGHYIPKHCNPRHKVAILVPYRDRLKNLELFVNFMHPFLIRQQIEYRIFVIEQAGRKPFNKGRVFNAGYLEILKNDDWQCIIFHDVDLLPADDRIRYTCPVLPRHMCAAVIGKERLYLHPHEVLLSIPSTGRRLIAGDLNRHVGEFNNPKFTTVFGGVTAMTMWQFKKANGFSNGYSGKGESADMFKRLQAAGLGVTRYKKEIARYFSVKHPYRAENRFRKRQAALLASAASRYLKEGLNTMHYLLVSYASKPLYTHIVVDISMKELPSYITEQAITLSP